ncbi:M99 family carboxypeptidase catalytic domain-containing protein [Helicobacter himalayensis]|uniref:M99 family carboxypeptidase catalytic domain-containing protein n=1 Tax=Helicobacter himalayensis TaxID=1591088 RepID=UPI003D6E11B8
MRIFLLLMLALKFTLCAGVMPIDFKVYDMPSEDSQGPNVLIMSGIQGDEPGAYNATNLFLQYYTIKKGSVRVIPSLSPHSMFYNSRGVYGDLNRKFADLDSNDPEFEVIQKIKEHILDSKVQAIFHMHDGSGFYRPKYINETFGPKRWGNCSIIDQDSIDVSPFGDLKNIIEVVINHTNSGLLKPFHKYHLRNTETAKKDTQMQKSLTFFAITHNKPAFAHEASKTLPLREKTYYHLLGIEGFLKAVGIEFERHFELTPQVVAKLINDPSITLTIDEILTLPLFSIKSPLNFFPMPLSAKQDLQSVNIESKSKILGLSQAPQSALIDVKYGNRTMVRLNPLYLEFDKSLQNVEFDIDDVRQEVKIGSLVKAKTSFLIHTPRDETKSVDSDVRANVIGFVKKGDTSPTPNEFDTLVHKKALFKKFAIDTNARIYRVEFYKNDAFAGMVLVEFE